MAKQTRKKKKPAPTPATPEQSRKPYPDRRQEKRMCPFGREDDGSPKAPHGFTDTGKVRRRALKGKPEPKPHPIMKLDEKAFLAAGIGCSDRDLRELYHLSKDSWYDGLEKHPEIRERLADARAKSRRSLVKAAFDLARGKEETRYTKDGKPYTYNRPPDLRAIQWWLHNRDPEHWKQESKVQMEHSGEIKGDAKPGLDTMTDEEIDKHVLLLVSERAKRKHNDNPAETEIN